MKGLASLVRLHRWELEEQRKALARLLGMRQELEAQVARIRAAMAGERRKATGNLDWAFAYPPYAAAAQAQLERLAASIAEMDETIAEAEERVSTAFKELKKYETALENQLARERAEAERRDQILLDEIALNAHRRKSA